jgi:hypothetical protein
MITLAILDLLQHARNIEEQAKVRRGGAPMSGVASQQRARRGAVQLRKLPAVNVLVGGGDRQMLCDARDQGAPVRAYLPGQPEYMHVQTPEVQRHIAVSSARLSMPAAASIASSETV